MNNDEVYYLHVQGEQRGPYTLRQMDHMLNSGIIPEETQFWREGLEQWQPVTDIIRRRKPVKRWRMGGIALGFLAVLLLLGQFFGPIVLEGWRETAQYHFTDKAAYWRARDAVRHRALPAGALVKFIGFSGAHVELEQNNKGARVQLRGELTGKDGKSRTAAWEVTLDYNPEKKQWIGRDVKEVGA